MKVKYIAEPSGHDEFEKEINDFIKNKKIIGSIPMEHQ